MIFEEKKFILKNGVEAILKTPEISDAATIISNIIRVVIEFADNSSPSFSCVLLFQFLVAFLTEDTSLGIDLHEDVDGEEVKNIIRRIYLSICSFSEGVFQMIENTCLHSDSHCGFLSTKIHPTALLQSSSMPKLIKNAQNVDKLKSKYELNPESANNPFGAKYHLEIRINDISDHGIVTTYLQNHADKLITENTVSLKDFFEDTNNLTAALKPTERERKEFVIKHYGLRLLNRIIKANNGDFKVTTVGKNGTEVYSLSKNKTFEKQTYGTEYSILLPLTLQSYESFGDETNCSFDKSPLFSTQSDIDSVITVSPQSLNDKPGKEEKVLSIYHDIIKSLEATSAEKWCTNLESQIVCIDFKNYNVSEIELAAKALITLIADIHFQKQFSGKKHVANFALLFGENCELKIYEFVRMFSVFYTKSGVCDNKDELNDKDGINEWMQGIQIALCSSDNYIGNQKFDAVNFIIAGSNIESARLTALSYAYYNSNLSLKYISAVRYFTRTQGTLQKSKYSSRDTAANIPSLIPFDLYLCGSGTNAEKLCIDKTRSWFIQQIKSVIETPIQNAEYGCKNENIHIKIGSKIHISDFYEAELLFHNISTIEKFAFLIASEILNKKSPMKRKIVLIGYESYSESLILKIKDSLVMHPSVESVAYAIYYKEVIEDGHAETLTNIDRELLKNNIRMLMI